MGAATHADVTWGAPTRLRSSSFAAAQPRPSPLRGCAAGGREHDYLRALPVQHVKQPHHLLKSNPSRPPAPSRSRRACAPELCAFPPALPKEGVRNAGCPMHPWCLMPMRYSARGCIRTFGMIEQARRSARGVRLALVAGVVEPVDPFRPRRWAGTEHSKARRRREGRPSNVAERRSIRR